jgi:periplasmic protein TonB
LSADVDQILAARSRRAGGSGMASLAAAAALHALFVAVVLLLPRLAPPPKPLEFVPVTVIPAQALGVRRPAPPRREAPQPAAAHEEPAPTPKPREEEPPKPAPKVAEPKTAEKIPVLPEKTDKKKPEPVKPTPQATPAPSTATAKPAGKATGPAAAGRATGNPSSPPNATAEGETGDQAGRRGGASGTPLGTTAFGSHLAGVDNPDFTYGYYLDRLLSLIDANWVRPALGNGVRATISFHIQRDGTLTDLKVAESSGYNSFDLAALRAVQNASPFPPLPRAYTHDDLGVHLIVY